MGKFKHDFRVEGSKELLEAFEKTLLSGGYEEAKYYSGRPARSQSQLIAYGWNGNASASSLFMYEDQKNSAHITNVPLGFKLPEQWNEALKHAFEPARDTLKVGDWAIFDEELSKSSEFQSQVHYCHSGAKIGKIEKFCSNGIGDATKFIQINDNGWNLPVDCYRLATDAEITREIKLGAKGLMLDDKTSFTAVHDYQEYKKESAVMGPYFEYERSTDTLYTFGRGKFPVYSNGVYATLRKELPVINKYKGIHRGGDIEYGCATFTKDFFQTVRKASNGMGSNRTITSIKLSSGVEVSIEQINQILSTLE